MPTKKEIREWLKQQGHNEEWFSKQLNFTDVDKWFMSNKENPPNEWETFIDQIMNPREINLFLYQAWDITKKILEEWKLKSTDLNGTNDSKEAVPQGWMAFGIMKIYHTVFFVFLLYVLRLICGNVMLMNIRVCV
ncbi:hypothetical protein CXU22_05670 [Akkermansia muciniphila]|uniref:Uncharacterized protein n=1 Tax=Akkermansia muciniphila TaxID=239935 RepID=A0A2N8HDV1_9BACT|nr:hypothetical protein [Akkermansia muciniphila]PNC18125.1 hypothetical protein CXU22_05670 [Akkermansia muciniphila]